MKGKIAFVILSLLALSACKQQVEKTGKNIIVSLGNQVLTREELEAYVPKGLSKQDSLTSAENFIQLWIQEELMYEIASKNVADKQEIEHLVENYRQSLIIYRYQEQLVQEKLSKVISQNAVKQYYDEHKENFKLDNPLIKGLFLKIPSNAPDIDNVRVWYKSTKTKDIENLDKYIVKNAVTYDDFLDHWVDLESINNKLPTGKLEQYLQQRYIEVQDSSFIYFINIRDYLRPGDFEPVEHAEPYIKEILVNQKKADFIRSVENDLYNNALKKGRIKFYIE